MRVPQRNVVNGVNNGWTVAKALLGHERSMIADAFGGSAGGKRQGLADLAREATWARTAGRCPIPCCATRSRRTRSTRAPSCSPCSARADAAKAGHQPGPESSLFKVYATELNQRRYELLVRLAGPQGLGWEGPGFEADELERTRDWLRSRANTIEGGTSEVQRNIIAKRVLGLPD